MDKLNFSQKNNLVVRHKNANYFGKDLELFKNKFPSHPLNNDLARANKFTYERLDGLMLVALLDIVSIDEILENREKEAQPVPEPRTEDDIKKLLVENFDLDEKDINALSEIIPLWLTKTDEEIISAVEKLMGKKPEDEDTETNEDAGEGSEEGKGDKTTPSEPVERENAKKFVKRINESNTIQSVEDILKEDREGGERLTVLRAGLARIEVLKASQEETEVKKKE